MSRTAATRGAEIGRSAASRGAEIGRNMRNIDVPWARCGPARAARETILQFILAPLMDLYTRPRVSGREVFRTLPHPVILVANHSSHLDTPTILRALPLQWRQRTAVAAAADYFYKKRAVANAVALIFNTVPLMRQGGGVNTGATEHVDRLIDQRWNLLLFPEGTRSRDGRLGKMRSGAAAIAQAHGIPIVPIFVKGTHDAMPPGRNWPKKRRLPRPSPPRRGPLRPADLAQARRGSPRGHEPRAHVPRGRGRHRCRPEVHAPSRTRRRPGRLTARSSRL